MTPVLPGNCASLFLTDRVATIMTTIFTTSRARRRFVGLAFARLRPRLAAPASLKLALMTLALFTLAGGRLMADEPLSEDRFAKWEREIAALEARDAKTPPPREGVVFVGSSSVRLWKLDRSFPHLPTVNCGFGGSQLADSVHFAPRIVLPHQPRVVVLYAGDNDLAAGKTPGQVADDYRRFVAVVQRAAPKTKIVYIGVKPSIKRWSLIEKVRETNKLIQALTAADDRQAFVDIDAPMLDDAGMPRPELYQQDGLHLTEAGYALWAKLLAPHLRLD